MLPVSSLIKLHDMVADKKKSNRIGRVVWFAWFFISGQSLFCPPPYYAIWNPPYLIILSAFSFNFTNICATMVLKEIKIFCCTSSPKKSIKFWCIFLIFRKSDSTWQKIRIYQKSYFFQKLITNIFMLVNLEPISGFILGPSGNSFGIVRHQFWDCQAPFLGSHAYFLEFQTCFMFKTKKNQKN